MRSFNLLGISAAIALLGSFPGHPSLADPLAKLIEKDALARASEATLSALKALENIALPTRKPERARRSAKKTGWPVKVITTPKTTTTAKQTVPSPGKPNPLKEPAPTTNGTDKTEKLGRALEPLFANPLSKSDRTQTAKAVRAIYKENTKAASAAQKKIKAKIARKLVRWYHYRSGNSQASALEIEKFRTNNPLWPSQKLLRKHAEYALFEQAADSQTIAEFFKNSKPRTGAGHVALATSYLGTDNEHRAGPLVSTVWRKYAVDDELEKMILEKFGKFLSPADHRARINWLFLQSKREFAGRALRIAKSLGPEDLKAAQARAAVVLRARNAGALLNGLSKDVRAQVGPQFQKVQWLRRKEKFDKAWAIFATLPQDAETLIDAEKWWIERRRLSRRALNSGRSAIAYKIAAEHGSISGAKYIEAEFFAGWVALQFLGKTKVAYEHFFAMRTAAVLAKDIACAEYWLARTALKANRKAEAFIHFSASGKYPDSFYGRLSEAAIDSGRTGSSATSVLSASTDEIRQFLNRDAVNAIIAAKQAGLDMLIPIFYAHLAKNAQVEGELALLIRLARKTGHVGLTVRLAKRGLARGWPFKAFAYPVNLLPPLNGRIVKTIEPALIYAVVRQESEFNTKAASPAGARGLMQLMPRTAAQVARLQKLKFSKKRLTADPTFNLKLGTAYLSDLLGTFSGSYILALAAYNAGPTRVEQWIQNFGDPRQADVDPIDWIERLPYKETRQYVQNIIASLPVFRDRLGAAPNPGGVMRDLGGVGNVPSTASIPKSK